MTQVYLIASWAMHPVHCVCSVYFICLSLFVCGLRSRIPAPALLSVDAANICCMTVCCFSATSSEIGALSTLPQRLHKQLASLERASGEKKCTQWTDTMLYNLRAYCKLSSRTIAAWTRASSRAGCTMIGNSLLNLSLLQFGSLCNFHSSSSALFFTSERQRTTETVTVQVLSHYRRVLFINKHTLNREKNWNYKTCLWST